MRAVVGRVEHDGVVADAEIVDRLEDRADMASCSIMPSAYSVLAVRPGLSRLDSRTCVRKCMRVELNQQKNGVFART